MCDPFLPHFGQSIVTMYFSSMWTGVILLKPLPLETFLHSSSLIDRLDVALVTEGALQHTGLFGLGLVGHECIFTSATVYSIGTESSSPSPIVDPKVRSTLSLQSGMWAVKRLLKSLPWLGTLR